MLPAWTSLLRRMLQSASIPRLSIETAGVFYAHSASCTSLPGTVLCYSSPPNVIARTLLDQLHSHNPCLSECLKKKLGLIISSTPLPKSALQRFSFRPLSICLHTLLYVMSEEWSPIWPLCILNLCGWIYGSPPMGNAKLWATCLGRSILFICSVAAPLCTLVAQW